MLKYATEKQNERQFLALTGLSVTEFDKLVEPFGAAWQRRMQQQTMAGRARWERAHSDYANSPLPTAAEKLLFILVYLKQASTQTLHGRLFGMRQSNANKWIHLLLPVLNDTLAALGECPARTAAALTATWEALHPPPAPEAPAAGVAAPTAPLFGTMAPSARSNGPVMVPTTSTAASRSATR